MTIRVLHVLASAQRDWTGIARVIAQAVPELSKRGYAADALILDRDGPLSTQLTAAGVHTRLFSWTRRASDVVGAFRFWRFVRAGNYDIVHCHVGGSLLLQLAHAGGRGRVLLHVHSRVREVGERHVESRVSALRADAAIAVSDSVAGVITGRRAIVVHSGVEIPPLLAPATRPGSPPVVGAAGRLTKGKGYADLLRALAALPAGVRVEIAGDGPERESLEKLASALGLTARVTFLGWVNDMRPLLARWTLFAHPSLAEGFSTAILEAMAAGLPVVATSAGGSAEAITDGESGVLVPAGAPARLAAAIGRVLDDPTFAAHLGTNARERVTRQFSVRRQVDATEQVYQSLLRETGRRGRSATALP